MKLSVLLASINAEIPTKYRDLDVHAITTDSRDIKPGALFLAVAGESSDGRNYINQAVQNGAIAVLLDATNLQLSEQINNIPVLPIPMLKSKVGILASKFFNDPSQAMDIIGVTGTNGKSSTCHYIAEILNNLLESAATVGTLGVGQNGEYQTTKNTTPGPVELQKILADLNEQNIATVAMEVTSHALMQHRVKGICFKTAVFTNLTQDHLDYHHNMENYWQAKLKLFTEYCPKNVVVNLDDPRWQNLLAALEKDVAVIAYTLQPQHCCPHPTLTLTIIKYTASGVLVKISGAYGEQELEIPVIGDFNLSNMLAAIASCLSLGFAFNDIAKVLTKITSIPGRMQYIHVESKPLVVVDFAHTPDALMRALTALRHYSKGKLWCVFGCGGDRDRLKRKQMLAAAQENSDYVIITNDNPRTEDPNQIVADMLQNQPLAANVIIELDRKAAIELAINKAAVRDVILIAGKGHENYQIIGTEYLPFSDLAVVEDCMQDKSCNYLA